MSRVYIFLFLSLSTYCTWGQTGSSLSGDCIIPSGEYSTWIDWEFSTKGKWGGTLGPLAIDFEGRTVKEEDGGQGEDQCWFTGSKYPKVDSLTGGSWPVEAGNYYKADQVGQGSTRVTYYRSHNRAPCEVSRLQKMVIDCPARDVAYKDNWLRFGLTSTTVFSERDGNRETRDWP